jgi:DNA repair protein SbcC/Rad50
MNSQANTGKLDSPQSILDAIHTLLTSNGSIDETRAKEVRKAIDALRKSTDGAEPVADATGTEPSAPGSELDSDIDAGLESLRDRVNRQVERRNRDFEKSRQLLEQAEHALAANELQNAEQAYHKLMSIMGNIQGLSEQRWQNIEEQLNQIRPHLRKLESWRHWGTTQARQELIEQVRQLKDAGLPAEPLAERIKQAKAQWQALDKSGDHAGKELWKQFDELCTEVYRPCAEHFKKLKQQRAQNLKQRQAIIDQLNARFDATDWKAPDWRDIDRFIQQARRDIQKSGNIDYRQRKTVTRATNAALERFDHYLSRERERSLLARERLIADIGALAELANLREALERLDALKKQWIITVPEKRNTENRLWKRFQEACDGIYHKRDAEHRQHDAERDEHLRQKQALVEELNRAAGEPDETLLTGSATLNRLQARWKETGPVPRKEEAQLEQRWRAAQQQFRKAHAAAESRNRANEFDQLVRRAALCRHYEQATLAGNATNQAGAQAEWNALPAPGGEPAASMETRFQQAFILPDEATLAGNLAAMQQACLRLEVLLELESPADCQAARMAWQVERLNASLQKTLDQQDSMEQLLMTALTTGAVSAAAAEPLEQRLQRCLEHYRKRM